MVAAPITPKRGAALSSIARRAVFAPIGLMLVLAVPTVVVAAPPAGWGWVTARTPTRSAYTPAATDQGNSSGRSNTVKRSSIGHYTIYFPGVNTSDGGGHVQVSALSSIGRYCTVADW